LNNHKASTNSRALFIIVAESIDIFFPISQLGWFNASWGAIESKVLSSLFKKGPPLPVKIIFLDESEYPVIRFKNSIKINNYAGNIRAMRHAASQKCFDAVFFNDKKILTESTMRNIFFIKQKKIITPPLSLGILNGTTRQTIKEIAQFHGYEYKERFIKLDEIIEMDEAFLTSCAHGVVACFWKGWNNSNIITPKIKNFLNKALLGD